MFNYTGRPTYQYPPDPVHTSQMSFEIECLVKLYKRLKPKYVLEIGSEFGGTLYHWLTNAQPGATVVSVDLYTPEVVPVHPEPLWRSWVPDGVDFHCLWGNSQTETMRDAVIDPDILFDLDFLFIDGDHTYAGVKRDFELYFPLLRTGGICAFHDLITPEFSPHIGVGKLWREIQRWGFVTQEIYALPPDKQKWGGIGVIYK